ncbi:MAG: EF-Tu/IF-2/RF-3 family GTPase, partial [Planctomycetota bacterium]
DQLDFPVLYASGRDGWASEDVDQKGEDIRPIFEAILKQVPGPEADVDGPLRMRIQTLAYSEYVGRIGVGRVWGGTIKTNMQIKTVGREGEKAGRVQQVQVFEGFGRKDVDEASAGDIVALVGLPDVEIGNSVIDPQNPSPMPALEIEPPTLTMTFRVNDSPFVGKDGDHVTSRKIRDRLHRELESNVALKVEDTADNDAMRVSGRGLMHLGILIETMRREGYELSVGKPEVVLRKDESGQLMEPVERLVVDVPEDKQGPVMEMVGLRRGTLEKMDQRQGTTHLEFSIPARGLIGLRTRLLTATAGEAIVHHNFAAYQPAAKSDPGGRSAGVMIANMAGKATTYKINELQQRGTLFVAPTDEVYEGMVVGEHARDNDIVVNITEAKQLTNFRTTSKDAAEYLKPAWKPTVEQALEYVEGDEYVEVTPTAVRLRKQMLKETDRKRADRSKAKQAKDAALAMA